MPTQLPGQGASDVQRLDDFGDINEDNDDSEFPLGSLGCKAFPLRHTTMVQVTEVTVGGRADLAGLQVKDFIYGVNGERLPETGFVHSAGWKGTVSELGYAIERAESSDGALSLQVLRPGVGPLTLNATLPLAPAWLPSFPIDPRMELYFEKVCGDIHTEVQKSGFYPTLVTSTTNNFIGHKEYFSAYYGIILLAHPDWSSTTGPRPYRNSIDKIKNRAVAYLNSRLSIPLQSNQQGYDNHGYDNWALTASAMFLGEYRRKAGDPGVNSDVLEAARLVCGRIQSHNLGRMCHGGVTGEHGYGTAASTSPPGFLIMNVHAHLALAILRGAGADFDAQVNDGSGQTIEEKFQLNWGLLKGNIYQSDGTQFGDNEDGYVGYAGTGGKGRPGFPGGWDGNARTPGAAAAYEIYLKAGGTSANADDLDRLNRMKDYTPRNWERQQHCHAYTMGGAFAQMVLPWVSQRERNYFRENSRFLFTLSRDENGEVLYFPGRANNGGDGFLGRENIRYLMAGLTYAIGSGNLPSFPQPDAFLSNTHVRMNSPRNDWPRLEARRVRVDDLVQDLDLDVTDELGNVLEESSYTASWSQMSGAAVTISNSASLDTRITFPDCGEYRLRLTVQRPGISFHVENYDFSIGTAALPDTSAIITEHPASRIGVQGGSVSFTATVSGDGPFVYQWKKDGANFGHPSAYPSLNFTNISVALAGQYSCAITHPRGILETASAGLSFPGTVTTESGGLKRAVWWDIPGVAVTDLTDHASYPYSPDTTGVVSAAEAPRDPAEHYGQKLSGWIVPPTTGNYTFYLATDNAGELWLSTDDDPANKVRIADITTHAGYREYSKGPSGSIALVAGSRYYIEALQKDGGFASHLSIAWRKPGDAVPADGSAPIPGQFLEYEEFNPDPLVDGLVSRWKFDEGVGSVARDEMGTANDGTISGAEWVAGRQGGALLFDSTDKVVCSNAGALDGLTPFTLAAWVNVNAGSNTDGVIVQQRAPNGFDGQYQLIAGDDGKVRFFCYGDSQTQFNFKSVSTINDGQWHHVAAVRDAVGGAQIYIDGALDNSVSGTTVRNLDGRIDVGIGADIRDDQSNFRGSIDDLRIYCTSLSSSNIAALAAESAVPNGQSAWTTSAWTSDATSGISAGTKWAYNFGTAASTTIAGQPVIGIAGPNPSSTGHFNITGVANNIPSDTNNLTSGDPGSAILANAFIWGGNPATITFEGLVPGRGYEANFPTVGWDVSDTERVIFSSGGQSLNIPRSVIGNNNGFRVSYSFIADATTRVVTISPEVSSTFHLYGLSLRERGLLVTSTQDSGIGTLRQAVADAAARSGPDIITFSDPLDGQTITLASQIETADADGITIDATNLPGGITISGGNTSRIFSLEESGRLTLRGLSLADGNGDGEAGGAILNRNGTLSMERCTLYANTATRGGAIYSTTGNVTTDPSSKTTLYQCTLAHNVASERGGAIANNNGMTSLEHCTLTCNHAPAGFGGGVVSFGDPLTLTSVRASIIVGNGASDVDYFFAATNSFSTTGYNLIGSGNATGAFVALRDRTNYTSATAKLGPLGNYGGGTETIVLLPGSPARNFALGSGITSDQRGFQVNGRADIGAYEAGTHTNYNIWIYENLPATANASQYQPGYDFDGDGQPNGTEWGFLTQPGDSNSLFDPQGSTTNSEMTISFQSESDRSYQIQYSDTLNSGSWENGEILVGNGSTLSFILPITDLTRRFYQIVPITP